MSSRRKLAQLFVGIGMGVFAVVLGVLSATAHVYAGGGEGIIVMTLSSSSAPLNTQVKVTVYDYYNSCANGASYGTPYACSDGSPYIRVPITSQAISVMASGGATLGGTQTYSDGISYVTTGSDGYAQFTVASAAAGSVAVSVAEDHVSPAQSDTAVTKTVSFSNPVAAAPATPAKTTPSTPAPVPAAAPTTPKTTSFKVAGQAVADPKNISVPSGKVFTLQGTTIPKGIVKLYIFSAPREASVVADTAGNWSYDITGLEPGSHHVEAEVADPVNSQVSPRATLASFVVVGKSLGHTSGPLVPHPLYWEIGGGVLVVVLIAVFVRMQFPKPPPVEQASAYTRKNATSIYPGYEDYKTDPTKEQENDDKPGDPPVVKNN